MFRLRMWVATLVLAALSSLCGTSASAFHGHHRHYAWYGYYGPGYYSSFGAWGYPRYGSFYYGSLYPSYGLYSTSYYRGGLFGHCLRPRVVTTYSVNYPVYYPVYYSTPVYYSAPIASPIYTNPIDTYVVPSGSCCASTSSSSSLNAGSLVTSNTSRVPSSASLVDSPLAAPSIVLPQYTSTYSASKPATSLVSVSMPEPIPSDHLEAVDTLFAAGQYARAASAYARLAVRYGNHDELSTRRFVALVASGDCNQAAVVFELAAANGRPIMPSSLPHASLSNLYGPRAAERASHVDYLAKYALEHSDEAAPLAMIGTWLELDGQSERALPFMEKAASLSNENHLPTSRSLLTSRVLGQ